eukprot:CAMPEP_0202968280 /NCGR_PEP_ID=MMETSP1396-20130829/13529_1 /ASSEMBLY_ACC=CAM_ASM_000872 /TAXON_ID= /ORGANISM="Pseudokeronopsis sp., Strain Brazil" /LENGTH=99 /DNA_ID=CAMNT_0049694421 /DNA_START=275 /DNA_END=571 /DNA_ORIENTATION=-
MEEMRLLAEQDRLTTFREVIHKDAVYYYRVCERLVEMKLENKGACNFLMDYVKRILEAGHHFGKEHFLVLFYETKSLVANVEEHLKVKTKSEINKVLEI